MRTSWQSATPVKPIARRRRPNKNSAAFRPRHRRAAIAPGTAPRLAVTLIPRAEEIETEAGDMFWICWNTAWSLIISGIMVATIVSHPDAEFAEVRAAKRLM